MPVSIMIGVSREFGGYDDSLFALKLSESINKQYIAAGLEKPDITLLTNNKDARKKIVTLGGDKEFGVKVRSIGHLETQLKFARTNGMEELIPKVDLFIEGPVVFDKKYMSRISRVLHQPKQQPIPLIFTPEYNLNTGWSEEFRKRNKEIDGFSDTFQPTDIIPSGFGAVASDGKDSHTPRSGILMSESLVHPETPDKSAAKLDEKVRGPLLQGISISKYRETTDLFIQYSQDTAVYKVFGEEKEQLYNASGHFLKIHAQFIQGTSKSQDVIMVGNNQAAKYEALKGIVGDLKKDGFQQISFYNTDTKQNEILYDSGVQGGKKYRVLYSPEMTHVSMMAATALSGPLVGATGDQSFSEAVSSGKIMVYENRKHKRSLLANYYSKMLEVTSGEEKRYMQEIIQYLSQADVTPQQYKRLGELLRRPEIQKMYTTANQQVIRECDLGTSITDSVLRNQVYSLITKGKQRESRELLAKLSPRVTVADKVGGKTLLEHASGFNEGILSALTKNEDKFSPIDYLTSLALDAIDSVSEMAPSTAKDFTKIYLDNTIIYINQNRYDIALECIEKAKKNSLCLNNQELNKSLNELQSILKTIKSKVVMLDSPQAAVLKDIIKKKAGSGAAAAAAAAEDDDLSPSTTLFG